MLLDTNITAESLRYERKIRCEHCVSGLVDSAYPDTPQELCRVCCGNGFIVQRYRPLGTQEPGKPGDEVYDAQSDSWRVADNKPVSQVSGGQPVYRRRKVPDDNYSEAFDRESLPFPDGTLLHVKYQPLAADLPGTEQKVAYHAYVVGETELLMVWHTESTLLAALPSIISVDHIQGSEYLIAGYDHKKALSILSQVFRPPTQAEANEPMKPTQQVAEVKDWWMLDGEIDTHSWHKECRKISADEAADRLHDKNDKLETDLEDASEKIEQLQKTVSGWKDEAERASRRAMECRDELIAVNAAGRGDVWYYQGDGHDHPESLTCNVVMSAEDFGKLTVRESPQQNESLRQIQDALLRCGFPCTGDVNEDKTIKSLVACIEYLQREARLVECRSKDRPRQDPMF